MSDEAQVRSSLQIRNSTSTFLYQSQPTFFNADVSVINGPTPGMLTVPIDGIAVDLSQLTTPGLCRIQNTDITNFVTVGVYDGASFYPLLDLLPGETYVIRLSRYLNQEFVGTGTGTSSDANQLMIFADTASCNVLVEAFDS